MMKYMSKLRPGVGMYRLRGMCMAPWVLVGIDVRNFSTAS